MGLIGTNAYLLIDEDSKEAAVIDLGGDFTPVKNEIEKQGAKLKYILNTHEEDKYLAQNLPKQLERFGFVQNVEAPCDLHTFTDKDTFSLGKNEIKVIHTPGHTPGSVCFLVGKHLFSGDTLFYTSVGRTDFEGGSFAQLSNSIKEKLFKLEDDIDVYPGHDSKTSIGYEKKYNCYFGSQIRM